MTLRKVTSVLAAALSASAVACAPERHPDAAHSDAGYTAAPDFGSGSEPAAMSSTTPPVERLPSEDARPRPTPLGADLVRAQWRKAANRAQCAALVFTTDGGAPAKARAAYFAGGWAVAFDRPGVRSAYGLAGTGVLDGDSEPQSDWRDRLGTQWPYSRDLPDLPQPAFAGYGLEGGKPYTSARPDGVGENSLAYVRVGGQTCLYNIWSRLGRAHLEVLLESLRLLDDMDEKEP